MHRQATILIERPRWLAGYVAAEAWIERKYFDSTSAAIGQLYVASMVFGSTVKTNGTLPASTTIADAARFDLAEHARAFETRFTVVQLERARRANGVTQFGGPATPRTCRRIPLIVAVGARCAVAGCARLPDAEYTAQNLRADVQSKTRVVTLKTEIAAVHSAQRRETNLCAFDAKHANTSYEL